MSFFTSLTKYLLFTINLVFVIGGGAFVLYGALMINWFHNYTKYFQKNFDHIPTLLISLGIIMFIVALLGLIAALKSHYRLMAIFATICLILFLLQVIGVFCLYAFKKDILHFLNKKLESSFKVYEKDIDVTLFYNKIHKTLRCCGYNGMDDFRNRLAPTSCCPKLKDKKCPKGTYYKRGCKEALDKVLQESQLVLIIIFGTLCIELLSLICAFFLVYAFRHDFETV